MAQEPKAHPTLEGIESINLLTLTTFEERYEALRVVAQQFKKFAKRNDEEGRFPYENIEALQKIGYTALTLPKALGGGGISLEELLKFQALIAKMDGSTALSIGWHMGLTKDIGENGRWPSSLFEKFAKDIHQRGALTNHAGSEAGTGSPTRGGRPATTATRAFNEAGERGWRISGRKTFTTLLPMLDYISVSAAIDSPDEVLPEVGDFLLRRHYEGVSMIETWDSVAMSATGSHDLLLEDVWLPDSALIKREDRRKRTPAGWLLHIPAVYLGIATAAYEYALNFANHYAPNSLASGTIAQFPAVQEKIGKMRLKLMEADYFLYGVAREWDNASDDERMELGDQLSAVKVSLIERALEVVDLAMRLVGARSLSASNPLQRYYRDVRAGLHNPPMEDMVIIKLAQNALLKEEEL